MVEAARVNEYTDLLTITETRGEPGKQDNNSHALLYIYLYIIIDGLVICHLPYGPTAYFTIKNCVLRHDIEDRATISEAYPHLITDNFTSKIGNRTADVLRYLFPVPKTDSKRVITFSNNDDFISFRHHVFKKTGREIELKECGPRFELLLYQIKLGTMDQKEAENEWVLRPYMNTAKKRKVL